MNATCQNPEDFDQSNSVFAGMARSYTEVRGYV
jgi:hypothetical protein